MELWIRSQDKSALTIVDNVMYDAEKNEIVTVLCSVPLVLGRYETEERCMELMNEIQSKLKNKYLAKVNPIVSDETFRKTIREFEEFNKIDLIGCNGMVDIQPISSEVMVYEMPKE